MKNLEILSHICRKYFEDGVCQFKLVHELKTIVLMILYF
jgi:hypothetical protein